MTEDQQAALRAALREHIETGSYAELHVLVDDLSAALEDRVGTYAPFIQQAVGGIRQQLRRAEGLPIRHAPVESTAVPPPASAR